MAEYLVVHVCKLYGRVHIRQYMQCFDFNVRLYRTHITY